MKNKTRLNSSLITTDIYKKKPKYFRKINYGFDRRRNDDIKGTRSCKKLFKTNRKPFNPLEPYYPEIKVDMFPN